MKTGFSLVELSIVLVILGLLTGGILSGQSLIRAAELRSVSIEYNNYTMAMTEFRDQYMALPGDMLNATAFWGDDNAACPDAGVANGSPGTCNGNGDNVIAGAAGANVTGEAFQFWKQLALAGLIEGAYTGISGAVGAVDYDIGSNAPASRINNAGWAPTWVNNSAGGYVQAFAIDYTKHLQIGGSDNTHMDVPQIFTPKEAWNIDNKMDDAKPGRGIVTTGWFHTNCATPASNTDFNADYGLTSTAKVCLLLFNYGI